MPPEYMDHEREAAIRLTVEGLDLRETFLSALPDGTLYAGLSKPDGPQRLLKVLDQVGHDLHKKDCLLIYHVDLLLSGMTYDGRKVFWEELYSGLPYLPTAIILTLPEHADTLFQTSQQDKWEFDSRLARGSL